MGGSVSPQIRPYVSVRPLKAAVKCVRDASDPIAVERDVAVIEADLPAPRRPPIHAERAAIEGAAVDEAIGDVDVRVTRHDLPGSPSVLWQNPPRVGHFLVVGPMLAGQHVARD